MQGLLLYVQFSSIKVENDSHSQSHNRRKRHSRSFDFFLSARKRPPHGQILLGQNLRGIERSRQTNIRPQDHQRYVGTSHLQVKSRENNKIIVWPWRGLFLKHRGQVDQRQMGWNTKRTDDQAGKRFILLFGLRLRTLQLRNVVISLQQLHHGSQKEERMYIRRIPPSTKNPLCLRANLQIRDQTTNGTRWRRTRSTIKLT